MADHVREQLAAAALVALTGLTTTAARVYRDRDTDERPLQDTELPGLVIEDDGDPAEIISLGMGRLLNRSMRLRVTAHVKALTGYSSTLNAILKECEIALAGAWSSACKYTTLTEVGARDKSEAAEHPVVRQSFSFEIVYITAHDAPDVPL